MYKLGILGLGNMGGSILSGIIKSNLYNNDEIIIYDLDLSKTNKYLELGISVANDINELFNNTEIILLAIKPQNINSLVLNCNNPNLNIISIVAGKTINDLTLVFGDVNYIRVMPNTPSLIGEGTTVIAVDEKTDSNLLGETIKIFNSIGLVETISDKLINEVIPLNGSMPAYLYYFIKCFVNKAKTLGFSEEQAKILAANSIIGSAQMVLKSNKDIDTLIKDVCSPGGATLKGIEVLDNSNLQKIIDDVCEACIKRAYELSSK